ncbi:MAG: hypothetical protein L3J39_17835 [Verrucomicrobiales bacterium]|nr:hypothetical protein [Verrucomicrobiales bacterium]
MGYSLYIGLPEEELDIEEWMEAVAATDGCRDASESSHTAINPKTGESLSLASAEGDVEIYDPEDGQWHGAILWSESRGKASFNSRAITRAINGDLSDPLWIIVRSLAMQLGAQISGEEGEVYDLDTAQPQ